VNPIRAWNGFWFQPISARPLGVFRIVFGLIFLFNLALLSLELDYWFTDHGLLAGKEAQYVAGRLRPSLLQHIHDPVTVRVFFGATAVVAVLFTLGWHTRVMGILLYFCMLNIHHRNISTASGADVMLMVTTFYLMFSPCGAAYSLDARRRARQWGTEAEPLIVPWAQRLIQIQLTLIYINTALIKSSGSTWQDGTALHYVLSNTEVGRFSFGLTQYPIVINLMTYGALMTEFALGFLLWFRAARPWIIYLGLALHGAILFTVNIPIFGELMTACYLLFLTPPELDRFLHVINPRNWFRRPRHAVLVGPLTIPGRIDRPSGFPRSHWAEREEDEPVEAEAVASGQWD
jgi:hypothetical protein